MALLESYGLSGGELRELADRFVIHSGIDRPAVTEEFRAELRQNMTLVSHLPATDRNDRRKIAMLYCLVRIFEPIQEEKLRRYLGFLLSLPP